MHKFTMQFAVQKNNGVVKVGKSAILQPKTKYKDNTDNSKKGGTNNGR